jgi:DNA-binding NtrC family response regulator
MIEIIDELETAFPARMLGTEYLIEPDPDLLESKPRPPRILLAEDDLEMRRFLAESLRGAGYEVVEVENGFGVMDYIAARLIAGTGIDIGLVVSDIRMPGVDGLRLLSGFHSHDSSLPVILITAFGNPETHAEAKRRGALAVMDKPFDVDELLALIRRVLPLAGPTPPPSP